MLAVRPTERRLVASEVQEVVALGLIPWSNSQVSGLARCWDEVEGKE